MRAATTPFALTPSATLRVATSMRARGSELYFKFALSCKSIAALLGVLCLRAQSIQELLGPRQRPLETYAHTFGFVDAW